MKTKTLEERYFEETGKTASYTVKSGHVYVTEDFLSWLKLHVEKPCSATKVEKLKHNDVS